MGHLRFFTHGSVLTLLALATACGEDPAEPEPADPVMSLVSGNLQTGDIGEALPDPIVVQVEREGSGVAGINVAWAVTGGDGSVVPANSVTGANGQASTTWTLGPEVGVNAVQASAAGVTGSPIVFGATAVDPTPPSQAAVSVGDNFFDPTNRSVAVGGTVTWTWIGSVNHNVTFSVGPNSVTQATGTFSRTFAQAGSFDYLCTIHGAAMSGRIVVQ